MAEAGQNAVYQRRVGTLRICASVDVSATLDVYLRIAFRAPGLTPVKAADHLEAFLKHAPAADAQLRVAGGGGRAPVDPLRAPLRGPRLQA